MRKLLYICKIKMYNLTRQFFFIILMTCNFIFADSIFESSQKGVVLITGDEGYGSGVIISETGYVLTNYHVIKSADVIKVKLSDGRTFEADLVGSDSETDIAVLRIKAKNIVSFSVSILALPCTVK